MNNNSNVATLPFPVLKDGDGGDDGTVSPAQIMIDVAENGYIVSIMGTEADGAFVYLFNGKGDDGPQAMIQNIINTLGLVDKVKLQK
jgi:hypothetical protein